MSDEHTDVRQHILDTAKPIILGKGFSAVGLNEILSAAGVPKGSFYHYFKSKEGFGEALLDSYFTQYHQQLSKILIKSDGNGRDRLINYWQRWLDSQSTDGTDGKCLVVKLGGEVSDLSESMRISLEHGTSRIVDMIAESIITAQADGSLSESINATDSALVLYNLWLGATALTKIRRDRSALESAMAVTLKILT
ncbi:TetR/AcrR family transcriptional regulator [Mariprofundus sp. EBB-1]|uniref:TetR/AcrR family transcriptional regulator n=1 Tax=Mariprofundus sp. EBB-1 TaxID=2650971 RepID=UPI000EF18039|nr:TetR/AcrR family transcriptional regulator [Mariprofundus sp. EBB-1]RLL55641.1 TetR/AcrR family transcriptional regulator [Mariprofundus sp. EBB-1]